MARVDQGSPISSCAFKSEAKVERPFVFSNLLSNQVVLKGQVDEHNPVRRFKNVHGRMICFSLTTQDQVGTSKEHLESHRVVLLDGILLSSVTACNDLIIPGQWLLIYGVLRHRLLIDKTLRLTEITEIHALSINPVVKDNTSGATSCLK